MALTRKDSQGEQDLYVSRPTGKNTWSEPVNLGPVVNSPSRTLHRFCLRMAVPFTLCRMDITDWVGVTSSNPRDWTIPGSVGQSW